MSAILDGMNATFGEVFGAIYTDAVLIKRTITFATNGDRSEATATHVIKAQRDQRAESFRAAQGGTDNSAVFLVLQRGMTVTPTSDDEITFKGATWAIAGVSEDPAGTHWVLTTEARNG